MNMNDAGGVHPSLEKLSAFDSGQLRDAEWEEVERHVAHCARCCEELDALPQDPFASLLRSSAGSTTPPPESESKHTPMARAASSVSTPPRRAKAAPEVPP